MRRCLFLAVFSALIFSQASAQGPIVEPGSPSPALSVKKWVKGDPIADLSGSGVYVVEFWATWCGQCIESIPHLTELAKSNPQVKFVGVSVWEDDSKSAVEKFVANMGPKMDYHVAYGGNQDGMAASWMSASHSNGIPTAFIVKNQKIQWIGHPMELEAPLKEVVAGTNDVAKAKSDFEAHLAKMQETMLAQAKLNAIGKEFDSGKHAQAHADLDTFATNNKDLATQADALKFKWLATEDPAAFSKAVDTRLASADPNSTYSVAGLCQNLAANATTKDLAIETIEKALKATKRQDLIVLYYATATYRTAKDHEKTKLLAAEALKFMDDNPSKGNDSMREFFAQAGK